MNKIIYIILVGCTLASSEMTSYGMREVAVHISTIGEGYVTRITGIDCTEIINGQATDQHYRTFISLNTPRSHCALQKPPIFREAVPDLLDFLKNDPLVIFDRRTCECINEELKNIRRPNLPNKIRVIMNFGKALGFTEDTIENWCRKYGIEYTSYLKSSELIAKIYQKLQEDLNKINARLGWEDDIERNLADLRTDMNTFASEHRKLAMKMDNVINVINSLEQRISEEIVTIKTLDNEQCEIKRTISDLKQNTPSRKKARKTKLIKKEEKKKGESKPKRNRNKKTVQKLTKQESQDCENENSETEEENMQD